MFLLMQLLNTPLHDSIVAISNSALVYQCFGINSLWLQASCWPTIVQQNVYNFFMKYHEVYLIPSTSCPSALSGDL